MTRVGVEKAGLGLLLGEMQQHALETLEYPCGTGKHPKRDNATRQGTSH